MSDGRRRSGARAVVVGGGLAGITAALALADAGLRVTLLEARPRLGGLAFSFRRGELTVDNGQHVYLRCCTAYRWFLDRIDGARPRARSRTGSTCPCSTWRRRRAAARPAAPQRPARAAAPGRRPGPLPAPLARRAGERRTGRARAARRSTWPTRRWTASTSRAGSAATASPPRTIEALWDLVGVATLNATADQASLGLAAMVFKTGLLSEPGAADIGWAAVPLGDLHDTLARKALDSAGVRTELRTRVSWHHPCARTAAGGVETDGRDGSRRTPWCSPSRSARPTRCCPTGALDDPEKLLDIGTAPILNVHVVYDRKVLDAAVLRRARLARSSGSSTAPRPPGWRAAASTWRCPSRPPQDEIDLPVAELRDALSARAGAAAARRPRRRGHGTSSSPGSAPRPSLPPPASAGCGRAPGPARPGCTWPARGPPPAGPRPWRARCAAVCSAADAALVRSRPPPCEHRCRRRHEHALPVQQEESQ